MAVFKIIIILIIITTFVRKVRHATRDSASPKPTMVWDRNKETENGLGP